MLPIHAQVRGNQSNIALPCPSQQLSIAPQEGGGVSPVPPHPHPVGNGGSPECVETLVDVNFDVGAASRGLRDDQSAPEKLAKPLSMRTRLEVGGRAEPQQSVYEQLLSVMTGDFV